MSIITLTVGKGRSGNGPSVTADGEYAPTILGFRHEPIKLQVIIALSNVIVDVVHDE
jgi:hypothetical protein